MLISILKKLCKSHIYLIVILIVYLLANNIISAQELPDDPTELSIEELSTLDAFPKNALTFHTHLAKELMFSYKYIFMQMKGNRDGTNKVSNDEVLESFPITPTEMSMQMHMFNLMYAPTDNLTFMTMIPYIQLKMDHITRSGVKFTTKSEGFGDLKLKTIYTFYGNIRRDKHRFLLDAGISFPTGSINERDDTPAGSNQKLPYPMQLGSGTFDLLPAIIYIGQTDKFQYLK